MKKLLVATTLAALTITTPTTVSAKPNNVRYSTGIVTGAKSITTTDGNVWHTKRKLHLCKGANVQVKFDTKGTKRKKDDAILKVSRVPKKKVKPEISIPISDIALVYTDSLGYTTLQLKDYGCVADDPNNISYETIKQMVEVLATINTTEKSVGRVCNYLTNRRVKHRVVSSGNNMQIKLLTTRSEISAINRFLEKEVN